MAPENNTSLFYSCKPQFFKVMFPDPFAYLMIPRNFHMNLPHKLKKMATLFIPNGKLWHVEICHTGQDIYFKKGWSEFAKAHDLHTGYFVVFRYEGNMIFKVKIFDTSGCLKNYSLASQERRASAYIEIETSSETGAQMARETSHEATSDKLAKRRKLANGEEHHDISKRKEVSAPGKILQEKKRIKRSLDSTTYSKQFEKILRHYSCIRGFLSIPKEFCVSNGFLTKRTIHLIKSSSEGRSWPVRFNLGIAHGNLGKGWREFKEAAGLQEGDRCIFRLVSGNSLVVDVVSQDSNSARERKGKLIEGSTSSVGALEEKNGRQIKERKRKVIEGSTSSAGALEEKFGGHINHYSRPILEWACTVRKYHLTCSYQALAKTFCLDNNLTSNRVVTLRAQTGKEWHVKFYMNSQEGRLSSKGWTDFSSEYGLKEGDKCIFKLIETDTLLVRVVKCISSSVEQLQE